MGRAESICVNLRLVQPFEEYRFDGDWDIKLTLLGEKWEIHVTNFLEQLVAEWLESEGYFVRRNVKVEKRPNGGYDGELDVVGFHPGRKHLVHYETSMDCYPWPKREIRFSKKFAAGQVHIPKLFKGLRLPSEIEQIALLFYCAQDNKRSKLGGGTLKTISKFMNEIKEGLGNRRIKNDAIPEQFTILRALQFANEFWGGK
jgi:hypothetical protein